VNDVKKMQKNIAQIKFLRCISQSAEQKFCIGDFQDDFFTEKYYAITEIFSNPTQNEKSGLAMQD